MKIKEKISIFICTILIFNLTIKNLHAEKPIYILNAIKLTYKDNNKIIMLRARLVQKINLEKKFILILSFMIRQTT